MITLKKCLFSGLLSQIKFVRIIVLVVACLGAQGSEAMLVSKNAWHVATATPGTIQSESKVACKVPMVRQLYSKNTCLQQDSRFSEDKRKQMFMANTFDGCSFSRKQDLLKVLQEARLQYLSDGSKVKSYLALLALAGGIAYATCEDENKYQDVQYGPQEDLICGDYSAGELELIDRALKDLECTRENCLESIFRSDDHNKIESLGVRLKGTPVLRKYLVAQLTPDRIVEFGRSRLARPVLEMLINSDTVHASTIGNLIDKRVFDELIKYHAGCGVLSYVMQADHSQAKRIGSFIDQKVFDVLVHEDHGFCKICENLKDCVSDVNNVIGISEYILGKANGTEGHYRGYLIRELLKVDPSQAEVIMRYVGVENERAWDSEKLWNLACKPLGISIINALFKNTPGAFKNVSNSPTWNHIIKANYCLPLPFEYSDHPDLKNLFLSFVKKEQSLQADHYTFAHGQRRSYYLPEMLQTLLWSLCQGDVPQDFIFTHVRKLPSREQLAEEKTLRKRIMERGRNFDECWDDMLYLNYGFLRNQTYKDSSSAHYIMSNSNASDYVITCARPFYNYGLEDIYEEFSHELNVLAKKYEELSPYGNALLIAVPKDKAQDLVYFATTYGKKQPLRTDREEINDIARIIEVLDNTCQYKFKYLHAADNAEFCLPMLWKNGGLDPHAGVKVFPLITGDPEAVAQLEKERLVLFGKIKERVVSLGRVPVTKAPWWELSWWDNY